MKTNKIFKNLLSLLTLGMVIFSCNKPGEGHKTEEEVVQRAIANIKSIVFTKAKNSTTETNPNTANPAYAALFVKKTPAVTYANLATEFPAVIEGDSVIKVTVPFDKTLNINTATTLTATITLNEKPGENVYLGDKKLTDSTAPFDYPISTTLVHANLIESTGGVSQVLEIKRKDKDGNVLIKKSFKVVFIHDTPSNNAIIGPDDFKFTVATAGANFNLAASFRTLGTSTTTRAANSIVKAHYVTPNNNDKDGTLAKPFEFQLRIGKTSDSNGAADDSANGELPKTNGATATTYFKADALKLPDGAYIEVGNTACPTTATDSKITCDSVNPITGGTDGQQLKGNGTNSNKLEYKFTVIAQDGTTKKYYKLTINASAPS
ncbi:hypothetical protein [Ichthyobacterium seriolicida]|uniref:Uncharacterized protein n=1 Tax=Ichthyobacterium seriolicida TaxID=242600 RepID=A0A1J1EB32_9FLAO|nr:hypothetical protein [Ichthyobacterium seriolicida]BAV95147.1 hypothetical protein JBKA6_1134 [Ichthyobacterium seriolicida]